ncbi:rod shape-determining protein MreD [Gammaproteobacteria bacterium]|nr:rod shape-determining protein MreD [Gammaproteobacteria bacterium]
MKFSNHLIIFLTIILGFWIDDSLNPMTTKLFWELNFGFLIFSYWVFAMPEKLNSSAALFYGLVADLFFSNVVGFNMLFFVATSYIIHLYVFRFRIFSYFQLSVFFSGSSTFYIACKYLLLSPYNYSYVILLTSFLLNAVLWVGLYLLMRAFRRKIFSNL